MIGRTKKIKTLVFIVILFGLNDSSFAHEDASKLVATWIGDDKINSVKGLKFTISENNNYNLSYKHNGQNIQIEGKVLFTKHLMKLQRKGKPSIEIALVITDGRLLMEFVNLPSYKFSTVWLDKSGVSESAGSGSVRNGTKLRPNLTD